jgi:inner membrane protein
MNKLNRNYNHFGDFISSYKEHAIFALFLTAIFFLNPYSLAISLIGASLPDFDHKIRKNNLYKIIAIGFAIAFFLHLLNLPYILGILIVIIGIILYFSNHRGFTHSLIGIAILSLLIFAIIDLSTSIISPLPSQIAISIITMLLVALFLNKRLLIPFIILFLGGIGIFPTTMISSQIIAISIFLGFLSHLVLDSFTPAGIELFRPISSKKVHKSFGIAILAMVFLIAIFFHIS